MKCWPSRIGLLATVIVVSGWVSSSRAADLEISIEVSPSTINLGTAGHQVTVHAELPITGVIGASLTLNGVPVGQVFADNTGELVARFTIEAVREIVAPPSASLTLSGMVVTEAGDIISFSGTDAVKVIGTPRR